MKFKSLLISGLCMLGIGFTSCDDQDDAKYAPTTPEDSPEVYFSYSDDGTAYEVGKSEKEFTLPVYRPTDKGSATFNIETTVSGGSASLFNIPASVTFADGEDKADLVVTFEPTLLEVGVEYSFTFKVLDGANTPYTLGTLTNVLTYNPWERVVGPHGEQYALYTDLVMGPIYGGDALTYEVELQKNQAVEGLYRLVNPYGEGFPYNEPGDWDDSKNYYLYLNCVDPDYCFLCDAKGRAVVDDAPYMFYSGCTWNPDEGEMYMTQAYNVLKYANPDVPAEAFVDYVGHFKNGVFTFPEGTMRCKLTVAHAGTTHTQWANCDGQFKVVWPGVDESSEPAEWESRGTADFTDPWYYPLYGFEEPQTWEVAVEENTANPGVFRLVNPYKEGVCPDGPNYDGDKYMVIDCTDANCVLIEPQYLGIDRDEDGEHTYFGNSGGIFTSLDDVTNDWVIGKGWNDLYDAAANKVTIAPANVGIMYCENEAEMQEGNIYSPLEEYAVEGVIVFKGEAAAAAKAARSSMNYLPTLKSSLRKMGIAKKITDFSGKHNNSKKLLKRGARAVKRSFK